jgi:hypothetical protein
MPSPACSGTVQPTPHRCGPTHARCTFSHNGAAPLLAPDKGCNRHRAGVPTQLRYHEARGALACVIRARRQRLFTRTDGRAPLPARCPSPPAARTNRCSAGGAQGGRSCRRARKCVRGRHLCIMRVRKRRAPKTARLGSRRRVGLERTAGVDRWGRQASRAPASHERPHTIDRKGCQ